MNHTELGSSKRVKWPFRALDRKRGTRAGAKKKAMNGTEATRTPSITSDGSPTSISRHGDAVKGPTTQGRVNSEVVIPPHTSQRAPEPGWVHGLDPQPLPPPLYSGYHRVLPCHQSSMFYNTDLVPSPHMNEGNSGPYSFLPPRSMNLGQPILPFPLIVDRGIESSGQLDRCFHGTAVKFPSNNESNFYPAAPLRDVHVGTADPQSRNETCSSKQIRFANVFNTRGIKVTIIDWDKKVFVADMVPAKICKTIRRLTEQHVKKLEANGETEKSWRAIYTYTKMDIPCFEVDGLAPIMGRIMDDIIHVLGYIFRQPNAGALLRPRSWKEPHLLKYQKVKGLPEHTGVGMHYDGSHFTWNLMLSRSSEYKGGGTYFRCLRKTVKLQRGQVLIHPGDLYHKGVDITHGSRDLVVCFLDGFGSGVQDDSVDEDSSEHEKNIVTAS